MPIPGRDAPAEVRLRGERNGGERQETHGEGRDSIAVKNRSPAAHPWHAPYAGHWMSSLRMIPPGSTLGTCQAAEEPVLPVVACVLDRSAAPGPHGAPATGSPGCRPSRLATAASRWTGAGGSSAAPSEFRASRGFSAKPHGPASRNGNLNSPHQFFRLAQRGRRA
jgi:hypothetical protein